MAVQTLHDLVRGVRRQDLTAKLAHGRGDQAEIDALFEQIRGIRQRLRIARDVIEVGAGLALIHRCEDRIKNIRRSSQRRKFTAEARVLNM